MREKTFADDLIKLFRMAIYIHTSSRPLLLANFDAALKISLIIIFMRKAFLVHSMHERINKETYSDYDYVYLTHISITDSLYENNN